MNAFVRRREAVEQIEIVLAREQLVVQLHQEQYRTRDRGRRHRESVGGTSSVGPKIPINPSTATRMRGSAATSGAPKIVPIDNPQ